MGRTKADNPDKIKINKNPNSVPFGMCPTR
jgi:hypothetical protein